MNRNASPFSAQLHNIAVDSSQVLIAGQRLVFQWNWTNLAIVAAEVSRRAEGCSDELVALVGGVMATSPIVEAQPSWRLSNDDDADAAGTHQAEPTHDGPPILTEWWTQRDPFAWYVPAHNGTNDYGIHFDSCKLSAVARKLADIAPNAGLAPGDWLIGAIEMALWHEVTHAWVEDLVSLAESITGSDFYTQTNRRYASYIFMEEAICNSSSAGMLKMFFQSHPDKASILGADNVGLSPMRSRVTLARCRTSACSAASSRSIGGFDEGAYSVLKASSRCRVSFDSFDSCTIVVVISSAAVELLSAMVLRLPTLPSIWVMVACC